MAISAVYSKPCKGTGRAEVTNDEHVKQVCGTKGNNNNAVAVTIIVTKVQVAAEVVVGILLHRGTVKGAKHLVRLPTGRQDNRQ